MVVPYYAVVTMVIHGGVVTVVTGGVVTVMTGWVVTVGDFFQTVFNQKTIFYGDHGALTNIIAKFLATKDLT